MVLSGCGDADWTVRAAQKTLPGQTAGVAVWEERVGGNAVAGAWRGEMKPEEKVARDRRPVESQAPVWCGTRSGSNALKIPGVMAGAGRFLKRPAGKSGRHGEHRHIHSVVSLHNTAPGKGGGPFLRIGGCVALP